MHYIAKLSFKCPLRYYDVYWYNAHRNPSRIFKGPIRPKSVRSTNSYQGHTFYFAERGAAPEEELWRFKVEKGVNIYIFEPVLDESDSFYIDILTQKQFLEEYQRETGRAWIHHHPRPRPSLHMWPVDAGIGHVHTVRSSEAPWTCIPQDFNGACYFHLFFLRSQITSFRTYFSDCAH